MTIPNDPTPPETTTSEPKRAPQRRRRWLLASGLGLVAALTGLFATRALAHGHGFGRGFGGRAESAEELREHLGRKAEFVLSRVDATEQQQQRIGQILDQAAPKLFTTMTKGKELRKAFMQAMTSGDHAKAESSRKQVLAWADESSKLWLSTFEQAMGVLDSAQRQKIQEHMQRFEGRRGEGRKGGRHQREGAAGAGRAN
jgi:Spy/CpxP family protein refolding chaperone